MGFLKNLLIIKQWRAHEARRKAPAATTVYINGDMVYTVGNGWTRIERLRFGFWAVNQNARSVDEVEWLKST